MRVLLDQGTPAPVAETDGFDVFITTDKNLRYQQNLSARRIAVVVVVQAQWPGLEPYLDLLAAAIDNGAPGSYTEVEIPTN